MLFAGGPATEGPGMVVSSELKESIRSHHDIDRDSVKHYKRAIKVCQVMAFSILLISHVVQFYEGLAKRVSNNGHAVDLFAGCLDQVGLLEMKSLPNSTNGVIVLSDSFATSIFKQSFLRIFNKDADGHLEMGFNATFDVQVCFHSDISRMTAYHKLFRLQKSSRSLVSLAMPFRLARSLPALVRLRLVSDRLPHGRSTSCIHAPQLPYTLKW
jgi:protein transport protein SEC23